jgi:hypothetical protein
MKESSRIKNLKDKIEFFIRSHTPKGSKYPIGVGWSLWDKFSLSREDAETFLTNSLFYNFVSKKAGSHYAYRAVVLGLITSHPSLSGTIFASKKGSPLFGFKATAILNGMYEGTLTKELFGPDDADAKVQFIRTCSIDDAKSFLKDPFDKVRAEAYHRIGLLSCAEEMAKDKSSKIRAIICQNLPHGHPALNLMMNDRSKWVFYSVLQKIDKKQIPLMLGSRHLKESFIKSALNKRMSNLGES